MDDLATTLPPLVGSLLLLLLLAWFSRQISLHIQFPFYQLTRSQSSATLAIFLLFLPGVFIHETAHWAMARLLGLKTGKFRVWPKRQGKYIGLGSVSVESRDPIRDSLVGVAPLIVGTVLVTVIGRMIFDTPEVSTRLAEGNWIGAVFAAPTSITSVACCEAISPSFRFSWASSAPSSTMPGVMRRRRSAGCIESTRSAWMMPTGLAL